MLESIIANLCTWDVVLGLVIGIGAGMIIGIIPGLGGSIGCALLIPLSYAMEPTGAIAMMLALYTTSTYGGSFSAILLHTPGTAASAATSDDGYALTLQGRALEAIGWSTVSSCIGGVISGFVLLLVSPPLARMAVQFNDPEKFFIALFGVTIIGSLAGRDVIKGLISGLLGMMVGCIGMDAAMGALRYCFGINDLTAGINSIPVLIGLFSISQVMVMCENRKKVNSLLIDGDIPPLSGQFIPPFAQIWKQKWNILRSSIIGTLVGILPGAGANIGCWVSYNEAKRVSKNPSAFGKGSIDGIVASESANNAVTGGAFVPLLTLSVPGSPVAAVVLSALLLIFGIVAYFMRKLEIPVAPMMLGLILGPMAEASFVRCITLAKGQNMFIYFCSRPICIIMMILIALSIFAPVIGAAIGKVMEAAANKNLKEHEEQENVAN